MLGNSTKQLISKGKIDLKETIVNGALSLIIDVGALGAGKLIKKLNH